MSQASRFFCYLICVVACLPLFSLYLFCVNFTYSQDFRHEVNLLVKLRHPNIVQFLGAVTDRKPLMLITEYLRGVCELKYNSFYLSTLSIPSFIVTKLIKTFALKCFIHLQGDLHQYLKEKGSLSPSAAINFSMDIARYGVLPSPSFRFVSYNKVLRTKDKYILGGLGEIIL